MIKKIIFFSLMTVVTAYAMQTSENVVQDARTEVVEDTAEGILQGLICCTSQSDVDAALTRLDGYRAERRCDQEEALMLYITMYKGFEAIYPFNSNGAQGDYAPMHRIIIKHLLNSIAEIFFNFKRVHIFDLRCYTDLFTKIKHQLTPKLIYELFPCAISSMKMFKGHPNADGAFIALIGLCLPYFDYLAAFSFFADIAYDCHKDLHINIDFIECLETLATKWMPLDVHWMIPAAKHIVLKKAAQKHGSH